MTGIARGGQEMIAYEPGMDVGPLEHWPFTGAASDYRILRGAPQAHGRLDAGGAGFETRTGIWRCTSGAFECTEQGDELMTVLSGGCRVTDLARGTVHVLTPGQSLFMRDGSRVVWEIEVEVTKVFFGRRFGGYG